MIHQTRDNKFLQGGRLTLLAAFALSAVLWSLPAGAETEKDEKASREKDSVAAAPVERGQAVGQQDRAGRLEPAAQAARGSGRGLPKAGSPRFSAPTTTQPEYGSRPGRKTEAQDRPSGSFQDPRNGGGFWQERPAGKVRPSPNGNVAAPPRGNAPSWQRETPRTMVDEGRVLGGGTDRWAQPSFGRFGQPTPRSEVQDTEKSGRTEIAQISDGRFRGLPEGQAKPARPTGPSERVQIAPTPRADIQREAGPFIGRLRERVRQERPPVVKEGRFSRPTTIVSPEGTRIAPTVFERRRDPAISKNYTTIRNTFGDPRFGFSFRPRSVGEFSVAFGSGSRHWGAQDWRHDRDRHHDRIIFLSFYFPFYFDDPFFYGFSRPGYYPSIYHYYGWVPRWCYSPSLVAYGYDPYPFYYAPVYNNYYGYNNYYLQQPRVDERGVRRAVADLRQAWLDNDIDRLAYYLRDGENISVYFDNDYSYSISADDYYSMTLDALSNLNTVAMDFDDPVWINSNEVFFTGRHIFYNPDNERQTIYVSYRLHQYGGRWYIISVGSSPNPIKYDYQDYRYGGNRGY